MPTDIGYVHTCYAPLSVRVAHMLALPDWRAREDILRLIPGPTFELNQTAAGQRAYFVDLAVVLIFFFFFLEN